MATRTRAPVSRASAPRAQATASWLLEQEARALLSRLRQIKPFALQETMLPAAAVTPATLVGIERVLVSGRSRLQDRVRQYVRWLRGPGRRATPAEMQRRFTLVRLNFNDVISQFDLFSDAVTQRSEHTTGVWLAGLDVFAADALDLPGSFFEPPQVLCYLDRGPGAAIRRARTRLPGGAQNPVAVVRVPRERMVGHGIGSSVGHEVGHQAAALLDLVPTLRPVLQQRQRDAPPAERRAWQLWERWISEIVADFWSVAKLGVSSTLGLIGVVSLPSYFVFALNVNDPHPMPYIRVLLSCAIGGSLYPHPQWGELAGLWADLYPATGLDAERRAVLAEARATIPAFVALLGNHRPPALGGRSLREVMPLAERRPGRLARLERTWGGDFTRMRNQAPTLVFAVLGQARARGALGPENESELVGRLLAYWALRSTLDLTEACAELGTRPRDIANGRRQAERLAAAAV
jgi:hypothetical protein